MIDFPQALLSQYLKLLEKRGVPAASFAECIKWSRYFLDYCNKYPASIRQAEQLPLFIEKLKSKNRVNLRVGKLHMPYLFSLRCRSTLDRIRCTDKLNKVLSGD